MASGFNRKALVLSPIASHPQDYGNRNRILQTTSFFKQQGFEIHFALYPIEPDWARGIPDSVKEMRAEWESFAIIPPSRPLHQASVGEHHLIDEWWDPTISNYLDWLFKRQFFDVLLVNYTYFSKAFEYAPRSTVKVLEMHDLFSGRKEMFAANGVGADFFYTVPDQERIAFDRADIVLAIKDGEAAFVERLTSRPIVISLPFYMPEKPPHQRPERLSSEEDLRVGFLGANNLVNVVNMRRFLKSFERTQQIYVPNLRLDVAGEVCTQLASNVPGVNLLGRVENIDDFYDNVDVVVAPLMFSTGIKIKIGEALSFGKPCVATENAFDGYTPTDKFHSLKSYDDVSRALVTLAYDRKRLKLLERRSALAADLARQSHAEGCRTLGRAVQRLAKVIVFLVDQPVRDGSTPHQERIAQWAQLCSFMRRTIVIGPDGRGARRRDDLARVEFLAIEEDSFDADGMLAALEKLTEAHTVVELVISAGGSLGRALWDGVRGRFRHITLDTWVPALGEIATPKAIVEPADLWMMTGLDGGAPGRSLATNAFRYEPYALRGWTRSPKDSAILLAPCSPTETEKAGLDVLLAAMEEKAPVCLLEHDTIGEGASPGLFDALRSRPAPSLIVAVGQDVRGVRVWNSLAQQLEIGFLHLSDTRFPILLGDDSGDVVLSWSYGDVAKDVSPAALAARSSLQRGDAGWGTYWNLVAPR